MYSCKVIPLLKLKILRGSISIFIIIGFVYEFSKQPFRSWRKYKDLIEWTTKLADVGIQFPSKELNCQSRDHQKNSKLDCECPWKISQKLPASRNISRSHLRITKFIASSWKKYISPYSTCRNTCHRFMRQKTWERREFCCE